MKAKLISITKEVFGKEFTPEELLVYIARVSNPSNQMNMETSDKLIRFLIRNKHWSPFDMINMTVEVVTSRAIAAQILRHWSIKPQEFSQRYAEATGYEDIEFRMKGDTNRQGSKEAIGVINLNEGHFSYVPHLSKEHIDYMNDVTNALKNIDLLYKKGIELGVAPECARMILPLTTSTTLYLNGSVRSWIHYMEQRCDHHAQKEHRLLAEQVRDIFKNNFPNVYKAIEDGRSEQR
jgi:thymidylate synthase (FAD)